MTGLFCVAKATNNEEYKEVLKRRNVYYFIVILAGIAAVVMSLVWQKGDFTDGFVLGTGTGLICGGAVLLVRNFLTLKDEDKIKAERLKNCDERNAAISLSAIRAAAFVVLVACYIICVIFAFVNPVVSKTLAFIAMGSLLAYVAFYRIYEKRM